MTTYPTCNANPAIQIEAGSSLSLSVDVKSVSEVVTIPLPCLEGIWKKATDLLNTPRSISPAPGHPNEARMVMSLTGHRPHLVLPCKGSQFKCDSDCLNFKSLGICSHVIAVAELNKQLLEFVAAFKKSKRKANFSEVAIYGMPAGCGKKGSQAPRKRKQLQPITEHVDRISSTMNSTQNSTSQAIGGSNNHTLNIHLDSPTRKPPMPSCSSPCPFMAPGPSYMAPGASYMSSPPPWTPSYHDWYDPPPPPPMAQEAAPFNLSRITGNISNVVDVGTGTASQYSPHTISTFNTESGNRSHL